MICFIIHHISTIEVRIKPHTSKINGEKFEGPCQYERTDSLLELELFKQIQLAHLRRRQVDWEMMGHFYKNFWPPD